MDKTGWIGLQRNTFRLGSLSVGKMQSMNESASQITTVNFGETFAMKNNNDDEGVALLLTILMLITITLGLNALVWSIF
tara:strand:- start:2237 stop:2473 length:237 start_codon:yes stop_codon:yes gene_type:complete